MMFFNMDVENPNPANQPPRKFGKDCLYFLGMGTVAILLAITACLTLWLWFQPSTPIFTINSLSFSNYNYSSSTHHLTSTWNATFQLQNLNQVSSLIFYDAVFSVLYRADEFTAACIPTPLHLDKQSTKNGNLSAVQVDSYVDTNVVEGINRDGSCSGQVNFTVEFTSSLQLKHVFRVYGGHLKVVCTDVVLSGSLQKMLHITNPSNCWIIYAF